MTQLWNDGACLSVSDILNSGSRSRSLSNGLKLKSPTSRGEAGAGDAEALGAGAGTTDVDMVGGRAAGCSTSAMLAIAEQLATGAASIAPDGVMAAGSGCWRIGCAGWMGGGRPANRAVRERPMSILSSSETRSYTTIDDTDLWPDTDITCFWPKRSWRRRVTPVTRTEWLLYVLDREHFSLSLLIKVANVFTPIGRLYYQTTRVLATLSRGRCQRLSHIGFRWLT